MRHCVDHFLVMKYILKIQRAAFAVFEPFLGGLVAADVEVPGGFGDVFEILGWVDENFTGPSAFECLRHRNKHRFFNRVIAFSGKLGGKIFIRDSFEEVKMADFAAEFYELPEGFGFWIRHAREIDLEEFFIGFAVIWRMQHGVNIIEQIDGCKAGFVLIADFTAVCETYVAFGFFFGDEFETQFVRNFLDYFRIEVGETFHIAVRCSNINNRIILWHFKC
ncbi:hypothetical protein FIC_01158 [Flavobacteriaceae bacterium 3519-10]|nr:hypothetical protein FIC_01158 [Flavobacteriaceae bacterium 3519-10]